MFRQKLQDKLKAMIETDPENRYQGQWQFYQSPLLRVARADDPLFNDPFQYCPALADGFCGECIERCPAGAISLKGKDKPACFQYLFGRDPLKEEREPFGYPYSACGKCQTKVACESQIP